MFIDYLQTPIGHLEVRASDRGITHITFCDRGSAVKPSDLTTSCVVQLKEYLSGKRKRFDIQLDLNGTEFQKNVWRHLQDIPFGVTESYGEMAGAIGNPKAVRAVGAANGRNPICIIVPCHRVIGSNGTLTGYAGGLDRKAWLLKLEGVEFKQ